MNTEPTHHPEIPANHAEMVNFSMQLVKEWNKFLTRVENLTTNPTNLKTKQALIQIDARPFHGKDKDSLHLTSLIHSDSLSSLPLTEKAQLLETIFQFSNSSLSAESSTRSVHTIRTYETAQTLPGSAQLLKDILEAEVLLTEELNGYLPTIQDWMHDFEKTFFEKKAERANYPQPSDTDFLNISSIFKDNVITTLTTIQLLLGYIGSRTPQEMLDFMHMLLTQKPSNPISPSYPSLPLIGYIGKLQFTVMGNLSDQELLLKPSENIEEVLQLLTTIKGTKDPKKWGGCPAIAIIPRSVEIIFKLLPALHPERYSLDESGRIIATISNPETKKPPRLRRLFFNS